MLDQKNFETVNIIIKDGVTQYVLRVYQFKDAASIYIGISVKKLSSKVFSYEQDSDDQNQQIIKGVITLTHPEIESKNLYQEVEGELDLKSLFQWTI